MANGLSEITSMWHAQAIALPELGVELPGDAGEVDYSELKTWELHDAFVEQFERVLPNESEEPRPRFQQTAHRATRAGSLPVRLSVDYDIGASFIGEYEEVHRRERKLFVPKGLAVIVGEGVDEPVPVPVTFEAGEFYGDHWFLGLGGIGCPVGPWRNQSNPSISYGTKQQIGRVSYPEHSVAAKKSFGLGIELLKMASTK